MTDDPTQATRLERAVHELLRREYPTFRAGPASLADSYAVVPVNAINALRWATDPANPPRPFVAIDPGMKGGRPTIGGTGLLVEMIAEQVWGGWPEADFYQGWEYLKRGDILVAAWYQARNGGRTWKKRWGAWAESAYPLLHRARTAEDYALIDWPPSMRDQVGGA